VLVAEDDLFWRHEGVDFERLQESLAADWNRGRFVRGAAPSLSSSPRTSICRPRKNPLRKLQELLIARRLEAELKKSRILELYLNVMSGATGLYGWKGRRAPIFTSPRRRWGHRIGLLAAAIVNPRCSIRPGRPAALLRRQQLIPGAWARSSRLRRQPNSCVNNKLRPVQLDIRIRDRYSHEVSAPNSRQLDRLLFHSQPSPKVRVWTATSV